MAKHVKNALKVVVSFIVVAAVAALFTMGAAGYAAAFNAIATTTALAMTFSMALVGSMMTKSIEATQGNFGAKFANRAATAPRQLVYVECRVGGTIVHLSTTGTDNHLLHMVVILAGHEIESLQSVRLNDIDLSTTDDTINGVTVKRVSNSQFVNSDNDNAFTSGCLVRYRFNDGSQTAVDPFLNDQVSAITSSDKYLGCAYLYIQMVFDQEKFGGGMPAVSCVVRGKKVYDPRLNSGSGGTAYSNNPALCIRDYISNTTYGLKALNAEINDLTSAGGFAAAANICDQNVVLADNSTTEKRYTANGFTNFSATGTGIIEGLLTAMAGQLTYTNGKFNVFAGAAQTPSLTITDDNLLEAISVNTRPQSGELYNTVKPTFVDATNAYVATDAPVYQDSTFLTEDTPNGVANDKPNYVKKMEIRLPFTVTHTMAQRIGRITLNSQRNTTTISCLVDLEYMKLQPCDWVYVTNERLGFSAKVFEVVDLNLELLGEDEQSFIACRLTLKEAFSSVYTFAHSDYQAAVASGSDLPAGGISLTAPSSLSVATDSTTVDQFSTTSVTATWSNASTPYILGTEIQYKKASVSDYTTTFANQGATKQQITGLEIGVAYNFRARHLGLYTGSSYTSVVNHTVSGTANTLAAVLNANATGVKTFLQNNVPTSVNAGDLWIDSNDGNKIYRATSSGNTAVTSGQWVLTTITAGAIGLGNVLNQAQVTTFASDDPPTSTAIGDLWMDTNDGNKVYRAQSVGADQVTAGEWVSTTLTKTGIGLGNVADERQVTIFREDNAPTATAVGDLWYDTNDNNRQYRASATGSSNWQEVSPNKSTVGLNNVANERQINTFRQTSVPTATAAGDFWVDTDDNNKLYRATAAGNNAVASGQWVLVNVNATGIGLGNVANERQITVFRQTSVPTALAAGDLFVDTDDGNKLYRATAAGNNAVATNQWVLVNVTKAGIGLSNVDNNSTATILGGNLTGGINFGGVTVSVEDVIDAKERAFEGFDTSGNVKRAVPAAQISGAMADSMTATPLASANWVTIDGSEFSPQGTTQDITVTYYNGVSNEVCVIRWTITKASGNSDYISACTEQTDSGNNFTLGSITDLSGNNKKFAECTVTHTASSATIVLKALISMTHVSGGGKS